MTLAFREFPDRVEVRDFVSDADMGTTLAVFRETEDGWSVEVPEWQAGVVEGEGGS